MCSCFYQYNAMCMIYRDFDMFLLCSGVGYIPSLVDFLNYFLIIVFYLDIILSH